VPRWPARRLTAKQRALAAAYVPLMLAKLRPKLAQWPQYHDQLLSEFGLILCQAARTYRRKHKLTFATYLTHRLNGAYLTVLRREGKRSGRESTLPNRALDLMTWGP
jgi:DNA-directed RNA polymerase specialized sigma subunit